MSYRARWKAQQTRASSNGRGWLVGNNVAHGIGIRADLNRIISERTTPFNYINGEFKDDRNLVVSQNTLSGVGKKKSQFISVADGIKSVRHYLNNNLKLDFVPITQNNIRDAVYEWTHHPDAAKLKYGHISDWDTGNVTNMTALFSNNTNFNDNISNWNVSNVIYMNYMFYNATSFNQNLSNWNVSNVTNMNNMFYNATSFDQDLSNWNVTILDPYMVQEMFKNTGLSTKNEDIIIDSWFTALYGSQKEGMFFMMGLDVPYS